MKIIWALVAVLVVAAVVAVTMRPDSAAPSVPTSGQPAAVASSGQSPAVAPVTTTASAGQAPLQFIPADAAAVPATADIQPAADIQSIDGTGTLAAVERPAQVEAAAVNASAVEAAATDGQLAPDAASASAAPAPTTPAPTTPAPTTQTADGAGTVAQAAATEAAPNAPAAPVAPATSDALAAATTPAATTPAAAAAATDLAGVERRADGAYVINGSIIITGEGTADKPFIVPWDLLVAARNVYDPKKNLTELPAWVKLIEGKRVKLAGFLLMNTPGAGVKELLVMQNQWDGCCIGVPPSPYDAVEVFLGDGLNAEQSVMNFGTLEGTFKTDPFVRSGWLLGLYVLEKAVMGSLSVEGQVIPEGHQGGA